MTVIAIVLTLALSGCTVHYTINVGEEIGEQTSSSENGEKRNEANKATTE